MRVLTRIDAALLAQRGHLFPWAPVFLALGIGAYFAAPTEPGLAVFGGLMALILLGITVAMRWPGGWAALVWAATLVATGACLAGWRAHQVAAPVLEYRYYGPVEGRVVWLDRSASDALRITLDQVYLRDTAARRLPGRVRISVHGSDDPQILPGQRIMTTAHVSPPQGPVEPGGFDFRRHAWFQGLGGVGYTRKPILTIAPAEDGRRGLAVLSFRMAASDRVRSVLPGDVGGFAAAVTTGDRSGISQDALDALRASNLAHLLAISGLHMGLLGGFVFAALRIGLALIPWVALNWPIKKVAALGAMIAAACYLALSGGNVATQRAFVMVAVVLIAVMLDRRAFSLRAVAIAALIVLFLRPEALMGPGFQMSFAATTALVAFFGAMRDSKLPRAPGWLSPVLGVMLSSAIAGAATAPVGAAHFNAVAQYGLIANLVSVPLMGILVIPAAVVAALLAPFGLDALGLVPMGWGLQWVLFVADWVAGIEDARIMVMRPHPAVLPVMALGSLIVIIWQGRLRWVGLLPILCAFLLWSEAERPPLLVADSGGLVGVMTEAGRALSKPKGGGFIARNWLENDGDAADQIEAAARWSENPTRVMRHRVEGRAIVHVIGKTGAGQIDRCAPDELVIASVPLRLAGGCEIYDLRRLQKTGSLALQNGRLVSARDMSGERLWNSASSRRRAPTLRLSALWGRSAQ